MTIEQAASILESSGILRRFEGAQKGGREWHAGSIDTRLECSGRLFFALKGEKGDGHSYALDAWKSGAEALVLSDLETFELLVAKGAPCLLVSDTLSALQELARAWRRTLTLKVIAVTGSNGKTTTKEFIRAMLASTYRVASNPWSYNNHIGVPLTILGAGTETEYLVSEIGANHPGEISFLAEMLLPHAGVVTNVGEAHVGHFGSREDIARAKAELLQVLPENGYAVLPADSEYLEMAKRSTRARAITFGFGRGSDYRVDRYAHTSSGSRFRVNGKDLNTKFVGRHNALNAACALAAVEPAGVEWESACKALSVVEPLAGRGRLLSAGGVTVLDESYNANPSGMKASLDALVELPGRRRVAVLGEMKELGRFSDRYHEELGRSLSERGIDLVYWFGGWAEAVGRGVGAGASPIGFHTFTDLDELIRVVCSTVRAGDVILVKASHACRLDRVVNSLTVRLERGSID